MGSKKKSVIKFKHGHAYSFKYSGKLVYGLYNEGEVGFEFEGIGRYYNISYCTNIKKVD